MGTSRQAAKKVYVRIFISFLILLVIIPVCSLKSAYGNSILARLEGGAHAVELSAVRSDQPATILLNDTTSMTAGSDFSILVYIALILLIILVSVMYLISRVQFKKLEQDLALLGQVKKSEKTIFRRAQSEVDEEIALSLTNTIQKNQMLEELIQKMELKKAKVGQEGKDLIDQLISDFLRYKEGVNLRDFEMKFHPEYKDYIGRLEKINSDLTLNEKRICIFLKLNMNSREISHVTGQSVHSINVARTRLRKKLNLTNTDADLIEFLISI